MDPAYGRETAWVDLNVMKTGNFNYYNHETYHSTPLMRIVHEVMRNYQARPHWTKIHDYSAEEIGKLYPNYAEFRLACQQFDPHGIFRNVYSERVLDIR
jgi:FAD/FMN-containing dehydrogenase